MKPDSLGEVSCFMFIVFNDGYFFSSFCRVAMMK